MPDQPSDVQQTEFARDWIAQTYLGQLGNEETQRIARSRIHWLADNTHGPRVLDIGCSEGILPLLLARRGESVVGVDRNEDALRFAKELLSREPEDVRDRIEWHCADIFKLELPEASFDSVVIGEVLEHLKAPALLIGAARRCLKQGGRLLITTPMGYFPDPDHQQTFVLSSFVPLLRDDFAPESLDVVDGYIRFVGVATTDAPATWTDTGSLQNLLRISEAALLDVQQKGRERLDLRTSQWMETRSELRRLNSALEHLKERREQALADARKWLAVGEDVKQQLRDFQIKAQKWRVRAEGAQIELEHAANVVRGMAARNDAMKRELSEMYESKRYRIGDAIIRAAKPSKDTLKLPIRLWRIFREPRRAQVEPSGVQTAGGAEQRNVVERHRVFLQEFNQFADVVRAGNHSHFVVMYGGTTFIQNIRANRPIRLTQVLKNLNTPVLFNFHRWKETDPIPNYDGGPVFQSPIDKTPGLIERALQWNLGPTRAILVVSYPHPSVVRLINLANVRGWATIYDCRDDWEEFHKVDMAKWYRKGVEQFVVNNCDLTCCVSRPLVAKMRSYTTTEPVELLPNAYDPEFLSPDYARRPEAQPIVGYFGHLTDRWFDWDSLCWIAKQRPQMQFELIGHAEPKGLRLPPNVSLLGPKAHAEICDIAARWRVGIIPFRVGKLADGVDPIKIYEYFALGLPVVSFRMPQIADYPHTTTVDSREAFVTALDAAAKVQVDPAVLKNYIASNTWQHRAEQLLRWADEAIERAPCEKCFGVPPQEQA